MLADTTAWVLGPQPAQRLERTQTSHQWEGEQKPRKMPVSPSPKQHFQSSHISIGWRTRRQSGVWCLPTSSRTEQKQALVWESSFPQALSIPGSLPVTGSQKRATYSSQFLNQARISAWFFPPVKSWGGKSLSGRVRNDSYRNRFSSSTGVGRAWHSHQPAWLWKQSSSQKAKVSLPARQHTPLPHKQRDSWNWELFWPLPREASRRPVLLRHGSPPPVVPHRWLPQLDTRGRPAQIVPNGPVHSPETPWSIGKMVGGGEGKDVGEEQECSLKKPSEKLWPEWGKNTKQGLLAMKVKPETRTLPAPSGVRAPEAMDLRDVRGSAQQSPLWAQPHNLQDPVQNEMRRSLLPKQKTVLLMAWKYKAFLSSTVFLSLNLSQCFLHTV